ncbi:hypothetical protein EMQ25_14500 [Arsenicitalea aurantiaca]|uniref:ATP-dependent Clp protease proteolytic subunit n=1 Tax=Arsenicitalea aurantiaca TaxID=1783274 RepID=A0A433X608_9HYPH|nr:hypothetical protein EMQ25_14500 [Arsenicitalea aurantiaca]
MARIARIDDGQILRFAFYAMLLGTLSVLMVDFRELSAVEAPAFGAPTRPNLPAFDPDGPAAAPGPPITTDRALLEAPLTVTLGSGGRLEVTGSIDVGAAERFRTELEARAEYITTIALNSPGGSVTDALEMGRLIHEKGFPTSIGSGELCASSCPLIFAGGSDRVASRTAAIGVHQVYAMVDADQLPQGARAAGLAMSDAQRTTAVITRHLQDMGVEPALWLHALETPPDRLYYFSAEELTELKLATELTD